ncbi:MAG: carboxypeptidase family protein [Alphaproteobacteria bacterium]|nr:carboxypeptidase family protein [Alphaproteobacteria bacterium]
MQVSSTFDSGNIEVLAADDPSDVRLRIRPDPPTDTPDGVKRFAQWFHFRIDGVRDVALTLRLVDMERTAYLDGWPGYRAAVSTDRISWTRADTAFDGHTLTITVTPDADVLWVAYFAPYDLTRVADLVGWAAQQPGVASRPVGTTLDGRQVDRLVIGDPDRDVPVVWVIARQHPGESMASWWMEGFLHRLLDTHDALSATLRDKATLHVVPHINPDGSFRGHLRTNASGANLNREWAEPTLERSPEVWHTRAAMDASGVDLCLDVHGDEALPYTFIAGAEGIPGYTAHQADLLERFLAAYVRANPDFQTTHGYPKDPPGGANLSMCTAAVAKRFDCLSMTLEMPFKDNADRPDAVHGWSPARCLRMGATALHPMVAVVDRLRT